MKLVIFDCDGTLVDSQHAICAAMEHAFSDVGLAPPSRAEVLGVVGLSLPQTFAVLAPAAAAERAGWRWPSVPHRFSGQARAGRRCTTRSIPASARW